MVDVPGFTLAARRTDLVTVRFTRWHALGNTGYQKNTFAGFTPDVARSLIKVGVAVFAAGPSNERPVPQGMVVK